MGPFRRRPATGSYGESAGPSEGVGEEIVPPRGRGDPLPACWRHSRTTAMTMIVSIRRQPIPNITRPEISEARPRALKENSENVDENALGPRPNATQ